MSLTPIKIEPLNRYEGGMEPGSARCSECGRHLKNPESIRAGIGPVCAGKQMKGGMMGGSDHNYHDEDLGVPIDPNGVIFTRNYCKDLPGSMVQTNVPHLFHHGSPDGFEWGYGGSGPNDFAWNIAEWWLRHLKWEGPTESVFSGDQVFEMSRRFRFEVLRRWIVVAPEMGDRIGYSTLWDFFTESLGFLNEWGKLPWEWPGDTPQEET